MVAVRVVLDLARGQALDQAEAWRKCPIQTSGKARFQFAAASSVFPTAGARTKRFLTFLLSTFRVIGESQRQKVPDCRKEQKGAQDGESR